METLWPAFTQHSPSTLGVYTKVQTLWDLAAPCTKNSSTNIPSIILVKAKSSAGRQLKWSDDVAGTVILEPRKK